VQDFTFVCPTEITAFSDRHGEFKSLNTEVLGVSVDSQFTHLAWIQTDRKEGESLGVLVLPWLSPQVCVLFLFSDIVTQAMLLHTPIQTVSAALSVAALPLQRSGACWQCGPNCC
jgi:hypothetical protein